MNNFHTQVVAKLQKILPTHYELTLHSGLATPCISYMELTNVDDAIGSTVGYSRVAYQVKVWGNEIEHLNRNAYEVDKAMRSLGFKRIGCTELYDRLSAMAQKVMTYEVLAYEHY